MTYQNVLVKKAYAKVNLSLDIVGRREDGYHIVRMVMQTLDIYDILTMERLEANEIQIQAVDKRGDVNTSDENAVVPLGEDNLVYKAAARLLDRYLWGKGGKGGVKISLEKHIPIAAGMAGGSSDAAATLTGLNELFELGLMGKELMEIGVKLGADIPYCIMGGTALSEGIGEELTRLPDIPECIFVVAKPPVAVSTAEAYGGYDALADSGEKIIRPEVDKQVDAIYSGDIKHVSELFGNVLEQVTAEKHKEIGNLEELMKECGALGAVMSGSGPTVYGIYDDMAKAEEVVRRIEDGKLAEQIFITKPVSP